MNKHTQPLATLNGRLAPAPPAPSSVSFLQQVFALADLAEPLEPVYLTIRNSVNIVTLSIQPARGEPTGGPKPCRWPASDRIETEVKLHRVHRKLIEVASRDVLTATELARRAGYRVVRGRPNSHVRQALTDLVRWGKLDHTPDGYRLRE